MSDTNYDYEAVREAVVQATAALSKGVKVGLFLKGEENMIQVTRLDLTNTLLIARAEGGRVFYVMPSAISALSVG